MSEAQFCARRRPSKFAMPIGSASNASVGGRLVAVGHKNVEGLRRAQNSLSTSGLGTDMGTKGNIASLC